MLKRRQEIWEDDYRRRRYLADASAANLAQRFRDILFNCHNITAEGRLGFNTDREEMLRWLPVLTHMLQEFNFRGGIPAGMTSRDDLPFITYPEPPRGYKILNGATIPDQPLIKLGYPSPDELWQATYAQENVWRNTASARCRSRTRAVSGSRDTTSTTPSKPRWRPYPLNPMTFSSRKYSGRHLPVG